MYNKNNFYIIQLLDTFVCSSMTGHFWQNKSGTLGKGFLHDRALWAKLFKGQSGVKAAWLLGV